MMNVERYYPSDRLKPFVKMFMIIESEPGMDSRVLPDTSITMAFILKGEVRNVNGSEGRLPSSVISGISRSASLFNYSKQTGTLVIHFHETGAAAFLKEPLYELSGIKTSLRNLFPPQKISETEERLAEAKNNREKIDAVERFLLTELKNLQPGKRVGEAIRRIRYGKGDIKIKNLIRDLHISRDAFEKQFRRTTGTTPKQFAAIVRLKHLISIYPDAKNLADVAHEAGYFDQAHFIKDFKSFTGQTPTEYFSSPPHW